MTPTIARTVALLALVFLFGITAWFFFVRSPVVAPIEHDHAAAAQAPTPPPAAKWKANAETTEGITTMLTLVRQAAQRGEPTAADVKATAAQLDEAFQNVFRRCTMTGDAHEALHAFLLPLAPLLKQLEVSEGQAAVRTLHQLEEHLERYATSFE